MQECEFQTLVQLLGLLHDYFIAQRTKGLGCHSLGQVFAPLLLRPHEGPLPLPFPEDVAAAADLIDYMILDYPSVFSVHSPCSSPYHKPPSRYGFSTPMKRTMHVSWIKAFQILPSNNPCNVCIFLLEPRQP